MKNNIKAAIVQHGCQDNYKENLDRSVAGINEAADHGVDLVLLPELHTLPYFCISEDKCHFDLAESIPGPTTGTLATLAQERRVVIVASVFEQRTTGIYHNTAVVLDTDGSIAGTYRKMHVPDDPGYYEKYYFTPGDQGFVPIKTSIGILGVLVCWDQWFPEAARLMALAGAELLLFPSAIGWEPGDDEQEKARQLDAWMTIQKAHAIANNVSVLVSNRVGHENDPTGNTNGTGFWGSSFIAGPQGEILARAATDEVTVITADIDIQQTENLRRIWPYFRDRRIDHYQGLLERFRDITYS
ncbi:MAG: carbon-nitrogen hydrolase [Gammaproteobacteria bacterium]